MKISSCSSKNILFIIGKEIKMFHSVGIDKDGCLLEVGQSAHLLVEIQRSAPTCGVVLICVIFLAQSPQSRRVFLRNLCNLWIKTTPPPVPARGPL